jgi:hypothetical protein
MSQVVAVAGGAQGLLLIDSQTSAGAVEAELCGGK